MLFESMVSARSGCDDTVHLGLGLNIVWLTAEFHGGTLHAENRPDGNGVRISINGVRINGVRVTTLSLPACRINTVIALQLFVQRWHARAQIFPFFEKNFRCYREEFRW